MRYMYPFIWKKKKKDADIKDGTNIENVTYIDSPRGSEEPDEDKKNKPNPANKNSDTGDQFIVDFDIE